MLLVLDLSVVQHVSCYRNQHGSGRGSIVLLPQEIPTNRFVTQRI